MTTKKILLYVQTTDTVEKQYSPLVLAQTARMMDLDAIMYYMGTGLRMVLKGEAEDIQLGGFPPLSEMIRNAMDLGVRFYACEASKQILGLERVEIRDNITIAGAGTLNDLALDADATMWF